MIEFRIDPQRCIGCGECVQDCPAGVLAMVSDQPEVVPERAERCIACQHCLAICPTAALSIFGLDPDQSQSAAEGLPGQEQMERLILARRSVRRFKPDPVDPARIARLMQPLAATPTGRNNRDLILTLVDDPAVMHQYRRLTYHGLDLARKNQRLPQGMEFLGTLADRYAQGQDIIFRNAPHMLVASTKEDGPTPDADCFIRLNSFELLAASAGLGTLWCGFAHMAMLAVPELALALQLPDGYRPGYVMLFGEPDVRYHRTVQRGPVDVRRLRLQNA
ncbi:MAG: nitroreductase family protein [Desulfovibrio sp.]|jgi:NAD-dependent dihydropyrimidine dehydrogenase PreA subunit/nitroreductase